MESNLKTQAHSVTNAARHVALALAMVLAITACGDATGIEDHSEAVALRITVGTSVVTVDEDGASNALTLSAGTHGVTMVALDADGDQISLEAGTSIEITSTNQTVARFVPAAAMTGTLVTATGSAQLAVSILHGTHADFGPHNITVNVQ